MILDVHNHYYPPEYLDELKKGQSTITVDEDAEGNPRVHYPGDYNIVVKGHRDIDYRQDILDQLGITRQVITFTTPGVHVERPALSVQWATLVNDCLGKIARERSKHFSALATLPLNDPAASVIELERAMKEHGLPGRHALQQRQRRAARRRPLLAALSEGRRARRGAADPPDVSARRRGHEGVPG